MWNSVVRKSLIAPVAVVALLAIPTLAPGGEDEREKDTKPHGKGVGTLFNPGHGPEAKGAKPGGGGANGISYHGGPVITGGVNIYYIWYGNWSGNSATTILTDLAGSLGGSPYFNINTTYTVDINNRILNSVTYSGSTTDNYSRGTTLNDSGVQGVVADAITSGKLPKDAKGVYFVLTSQDVAESSGFCTQYCGWHTHGIISGLNVPYAFIGNSDRCPTACSAQSTSPNGNTGADGMASIIAHELEEMVTDPYLNAWYDQRGQENADKCAWTFGTVFTTPNGSFANMQLGTRNFLIQRNWVNAGGGYCAAGY